MRRERTNIACAVIVAALAAAAFFGVLLIPGASAQRQGYVEKRVVSTGTATGHSAFANQLAPNPVTGMCLQPDASNRTVWGPCGSTLPTGTAGQFLGVKAATATRTVVVTGSQTSTATETYSFTQSVTGTGTGTYSQNATGTYTYTATSTSTGISTSGVVDVGTTPRDVCIMGDYAYVANGGSGTVSIVNISNPASPSTSGLSAVTVGSDPRELSCADGWVYVSNYGGDSISVIDASTPSSAHVESTFSTPAGCLPRGSAVRGNRLYVVCYSSGTSGSFLTINSSNKASLSQIGSAFTIPNGPTDVTVDDDYYARVACGAGQKVVTLELSGGGTDVPIQAGFEDNTGAPFGIAQKSGLFIGVVTNVDNKFYLYNTNVSPQLIGSSSAGSGLRHLAFYGTVAIVTDAGADKVKVYSVATSGNPSLLDEITITGGGPFDVKISGDYAWVTRSADAKLQSFYVGKYQQFSGTGTTTNVVTATGTVATTGTQAATGTHSITGTGIYTANTTATGTASGSDTWAAVNGTLYAGDNIRFTKGTGTDTDTSAAMQDEPKIHLSGLTGTTGVLSKKTTDGWGDSCVSEGTSSVDSSKTIRATGGTVPSSGAGVELLYSPGSEVGYLISIDRGAATHKSLNISGSSLRFVVNNTVTMLAPETAGTEGQQLLKGPSNSSVWSTPNIPGGDLFLYPSGNNIMFFDAPYPSETTAYWDVTATTSPSWFTWAGGRQYVEVVNRFAGYGGSPAAYTPATWISPGVVSYYFSLKASAAVTTHAVFGLCTNATTLSSTVQDVSLSVTSSSWTVFSGTFALSSGLLVPSGNVFCVGFYSQTSSGSATSYIGVNYTNYTRLNGPWIKSGSNSWTW